jgi:hypothetical protein
MFSPIDGRHCSFSIVIPELPSENIAIVELPGFTTCNFPSVGVLVPIPTFCAATRLARALAKRKLCYIKTSFGAEMRFGVSAKGRKIDRNSKAMWNK